MAVAAPAYLFLFASTLASLLAVTSQAELFADDNSSSFIRQLQEAKLKLARLGSDFEHAEARDRRLEENGKEIEEMEKEFAHLMAILTNLKDELLAGDSVVITLEKEIRDLWDKLRKNEFDIQVLILKAKESDTSPDTVALHLKKAEDLLAERWILIHQFEQALQLLDVLFIPTAMRLMEAQTQAKYSRSPFLKYMNDLNGNISKAKRFDVESGLSSYISSMLEQLKRLYSTVKEFHFELQSFVRQIMEHYEFTKSIANDEVVFFLVHGSSYLLTYCRV
ncbi:unnamed protein product [Linum tenue]|uniref:Uncharacterized protein n=1 Tax=Linum tenue TaxID=586396 RepID=A0AAV0JEM5_9ROSI|nr:unnamed protein product [Linum tenue]